MVAKLVYGVRAEIIKQRMGMETSLTDIIKNKKIKTAILIRPHEKDVARKNIIYNMEMDFF